MRGACVVQEDLEAAEPADGVGYGCAKRFRLGTVGLDRQGDATGADDLLLEVVCWALGVSVGERHGGTIGREPPDDAGADPPRTPGDQRSPARERGARDVVELCCLSHECSLRIERFGLPTDGRPRALLPARLLLRGGRVSN